MIKTEMKLKMVSENVAVLQRNGEDMVCPLVPPMQIRQRFQNALGQVSEQISVQKSPCNSNCPLFEINPRNSISINCSGLRVDYSIIEIIPFQQAEVKNNTTDSTNENNNNIISLNK